MLLQMLEGRGATGSGARVIGTALTSYARNNNKGKRSRTKLYGSLGFSYNHGVLVLGPTSIFLSFAVSTLQDKISVLCAEQMW